MSRIVVTGGSGPLGQHAIRELLDNGYDVLSLDRIAPGVRKTNIGSQRKLERRRFRRGV